MKKRMTKHRKAMKKLGKEGGNANVKIHGKGHMREIIQNYWDSPAGKARKAAAKSRSKDLVTKS